MANVNFKRGLQSSINTLIAGSGNRYDEGTFYLTTDTNRLYFAQAADKLVDLNQYIHIWTGSSLPTATTPNVTLEEGDIYYWDDFNILAIRDSDAEGGWTQLNPDTYLNPSTTAVSVTAGTTSGSVRVATTVTDSAGNSVSGNFQLKPGDGNTTIVNDGNEITITTKNDDTIDTYAIGTSASAAESSIGHITLTPTHNGVTQTAQVINIQGTGNTVVSSDASGTITIDSSGGVESVSQSFDQQGKLRTLTTLSAGGSLTPQFVTPQIKYGENADQTGLFAGASAVDTTGTATLSVYTIAEVNQKIADAIGDADALKYQGVVTQTNASTKLIAAANAGEVYKAGEDISLPGLINPFEQDGYAKAGDLIIASGSDGQVVWEVIPSGDDQAIDVDLNTTNSFRVVDNSTILGGLTLAGDNHHINIAETVSGNKVKTLTISHAAPASGTAVSAAAVVPAVDSGTGNPNANATELAPADNSTGNSIDIPVVTGLSVDSYGHVYEASAKTYRIWDTHGVMGQISNVVTLSGNNQATVALNGSFDGTAFTTGANSLKITTDQDSLRLSSPNNSTVKIELVWGTF